MRGHVKIIFTVSESPEGGYKTRALGYRHVVTIEELKAMVQKIVKLSL